MSDLNIFERATRLKVRFNSPQGQLSVEDLWDVALTATNPNRANLNDIAKGLFIQLKETGEVNFVPTAQQKDDLERRLLQLMFDVVKHVIDVKVTERDARVQAQEKAAKKQQLYAALEAAERRETDAKTPEEIRAMIAALD